MISILRRLTLPSALQMVSLLLLSTPVLAVNQFVIIPTADDATASALSADGLTVVGQTAGQAFRWSEADGVELLGRGPAEISSSARAVSADGSVVVGSFFDANGLEQPFRWTRATGITAMFPSAPAGAGGVATDVSNDGITIVGEFGIQPTGENCSAMFSACTLLDPGSVRAFTWTAAQGISFLDFAESSETPEGSTALGISGDGSIVTGTQFSFGRTCGLIFDPSTDSFSDRCTRPPGRPQQVFQSINSISTALPFVTTGDITSVSSDGSTLTGQLIQTQPFRLVPFRWRLDTGLMELDFDSSLVQPNTGIPNPANAASADGSIVAGDFGLWVDGTTVNLSNLLINGYGLRAHGFSLQTALVDTGSIRAFSADGQSFTGTAGIASTSAFSPPRRSRAFLVRVDTASITSAAASLPPFVSDTFAGFSRPLLSAALPLARSTEVNDTVTVFVSLINQSQQDLEGCAIGFNGDLPISFTYAQTEPINNEVIGPADELFSLAPGEVKSFVVGMTPAGPFSSTRIDAVYECGNSLRVVQLTELNDIVLASSTFPVPDILAESATISNDGIAALDANNQAAFSVATLNLGAESGPLRVDAFPTGGLAAFTTSICETDPISGDCLGAAASFLEVDYDELEERTFGVFVSSSQPIEPLFDIRRVRVQFTDDAGELRGSTSVAVVTQ